MRKDLGNVLQSQQMPSHTYLQGPEPHPNPVCSTWSSSRGSRPCQIHWAGNDLKWNHHVQNVTTKANRTLGYIRRNIRTKHKSIRQTTYQTLVRPQLKYASPVWSPHTDTNVSKIETVQRRAARWVTHDYSSYSSVTQMFNTLG